HEQILSLPVTIIDEPPPPLPPFLLILLIAASTLPDLPFGSTSISGIIIFILLQVFATLLYKFLQSIGNKTPPYRQNTELRSAKFLLEPSSFH
ncbi:hypothetical protein PIB30_045770, partial [Stylosanthes scabra]|nr:hypothetical protein [Stylosanthes scabra]